MVAAHDELLIAASATEVRRASDWLEAACLQRKVPVAQLERLLVSLNEVLANVIAHGGAAAHASPVSLRLEVDGDAHSGQACVTESDAAIAFNPLTAADAARPQTLMEAVPGGRGLVMIRHFSDWLHYARVDGRNRFAFGVRWGAP